MAALSTTSDIEINSPPLSRLRQTSIDKTIKQFKIVIMLMMYNTFDWKNCFPDAGVPTILLILLFHVLIKTEVFSKIWKVHNTIQLNASLSWLTRQQSCEIVQLKFHSVEGNLW